MGETTLAMMDEPHFPTTPSSRPRIEAQGAVLSIQFLSAEELIFTFSARIDFALNDY